MTKDEALDLALEALEKSVATCFDRYAHEQVMSRPEHFINQAITAIKQARALDKKAENARELGLDYEPADGTQVSKVWWDGEKLMAKPIPLEDIYQPVQEPVGLIDRLKNPEDHYEFTDPKKANAVLMSLCQEAADALAAAPVREPVAWMDKYGEIYKDVPEVLSTDTPLYTTPPAARRQWVGLSQDELDAMFSNTIKGKKLVNWVAKAIEAKLKQKNIAAQPAPVQPVKPSLWEQYHAAQPAPVQLVQEPRGYQWLDTSVFRKKLPENAEPDAWNALYTTPPAQPAPVLEGRDWSLLEATQESLREHMAEIKRLKEAQPAVPDAMTSADIQEHIEYVAGWNECRQAMLKGMKL